MITDDFEAIRAEIERRYRDDMAALDRVLALSKQLEGTTATAEPADELGAAGGNKPRICETDEYRQANNGRDSEVFAMLDAGKNMADISRKLCMNYSRVNSIKNRWQKKAGKDYHAVARYDDADEDETEDEAEPNEPATNHQPEPADPPEPVRGGKDGTDTYHKPMTPTEVEMLRNRFEQLLRAAKRMSYTQILQACHFSPGQFAQVLKVANVEKVDGLYQIKRRF